MIIRTLLIAGVLSMPLPSSGRAEGNTPSSAQPMLTGDLVIQWSDEKRFIYVVSSEKPMLFEKNGRQIKPGRMYTDGGSIPRIFWAFRGFSPWGYAPAYVVHDWLFHQHRCQRDQAPNAYTMAEANVILDDIVGILFAQNRVDRNETARGLIKWAVDHYAQGAWNEPCDRDPPLALSPGVQITVEHLRF
jgi:hypothetical protein